MALKPAKKVIWGENEVILKGDFTAEHEYPPRGGFKNFPGKKGKDYSLKFCEETGLWYFVTAEYLFHGELTPVAYLRRKIEKSGDGAFSDLGMMLAHKDKSMLEKIYNSNNLQSYWEYRTLKIKF